MTESDDGNGGAEEAGSEPQIAGGEFPPRSATAQVTFGAHSSRGRLRLVNEDHYLVMRMGRHLETLLTSLHDEDVSARFDEYGYAMIVADGMGGTGAGEAASRLAIATLVNLVRRFGQWKLRIDDEVAADVMARVERFYRHLNSTVALERRSETVRTEQTTLTATFGAGEDLFFAHVGHSRAYLLRQGQLMRLTRDHTIGRQRTSTVPLAPLEALSASARDLSHVLTDTIGMTDPVGPAIDIERFRLDDDDRVLVCTNGLTDSIDEDKIGELLASEQSPEDQAHALVDLAMAGSGDDDVTALVARYRLPR